VLAAKNHDRSRFSEIFSHVHVGGHLEYSSLKNLLAGVMTLIAVVLRL
jgi:hypothetical protein